VRGAAAGVTRRERIVVAGIIGVALVLRVAWVLYAARVPRGLHDPSFYYLYGEQLARGHGYRLPDGSVTAYYPPGYSMALTPFFWLAYHTPLHHLREVEVGIAVTLNIAWSLASIVLAFLVGRRVSGSSRGGYVAAAVLAMWPNLIFHTAVALTETLFLFLLLVVLHLASCAPWSDRRWEPWRIVAVGVVLGAATLVRPVTLPIFPALAVAFAVARFGWRRALAVAGAVTAVAVAVLVPWVVRNAIVMDSVTLFTNTGDNLCMSRRVGGSGAFEFPNERCFPDRFTAIPRPRSEIERDAYGRKLAIDFVKAHPGEEARLVFRRIGATFRSDADGIAAVESYGDDPFLAHGTRDLLQRTATAYGALAGLAGIAGLALIARRRGPVDALLVLVAAGLLIPPLAFFGDPRFHVPAVPIAAIGVGVLVSRLSASRSPAADRRSSSPA
jgi:4-amino-4-deoxy-L-arabinose transferase-like glycosyltransferase